MEEYIFETTDYEGTPVVLSRSTWRTKAGNDIKGTHPEIQDYLENIKNVIKSPDIVFKSTHDDRSCIFYQLNVCRGDFAGKHLAVVVKYVQEKTGLRGYVSTMYITRTVYSKGLKLWEKK